MVAYNAARVRDDVGTSTASAGRMPQGGASSGSVAAARTAAALAQARLSAADRDPVPGQGARFVPNCEELTFPRYKSRLFLRFVPTPATRTIVVSLIAVVPA